MKSVVKFWFPVSSSLILVSAFILLAGCESVEHRIQKNPQLWKSLSQNEKLAVENRTIDIGHSTDVVFFILGNPDQMRTETEGEQRREVWIYTRIFTRYEGTDLAGYRSRIYYDSLNRVYRVFYIPKYVNLYSEHSEVEAEIEFEDGRVAAITEVKR